MRLAFAHDHRFAPDGQVVRSAGSFPAAAWDRYLTDFETLTVLCRRGKPVGHGEIASRPGVSFETLPSLGNPLNATLKRGAVIRRIRTALRDVDACVVRLPSEIGFAVQSVARQIGLPCAVEVAGCPWDGLRHHGSTIARAYARVARARMRRAVGRAGHVLYVTDAFLQTRYPPGPDARVVACSNVMIPAPSPAVLAARLDRLSRPRARIRLGLIGSLKTRTKGIQTVIEALPLLPPGTPDLVFEVLGAGDPGPWLAQAARFGVAEKVVMAGTRDAGAPVLRWLDDIDLYLQPSLKEGLPRALIEAMSRGCPAIGTRCAGIPELLDATRLVNPGNAHALSAQIAATSVTLARGDPGGDLDVECRRNWQRAGDYDAATLNARRRAFFEDFATCARRTEPPAIEGMIA